MKIKPMIKKRYFLIFILFFVKILGTDPLSKITITSNKAICQKDKKIAKTLIFTYLENVLVTFSDNSKIKSDELEIELDTTKINDSLDNKTTNSSFTETLPLNNPNQKNLSQFKKITFKKNIEVTSTNKIIQADQAELFLSEKKCNLSGNVKIKQIKQNPKDLPILTECNSAMLDMESEQVTFLGDTKRPVSTKIELSGHPGFLKKPKTKAEKKAENKELRKKRFFAKRKKK